MMLAFTCVFVGLCLILLEVFFMGGLLGLLGAGLLCYACWITSEYFGWTIGLGLFFILLVFVGILLVFEIKWLAKSRLGKKFFVRASIQGVGGSVLPDNLVGKSATTLTDLYPSGQVELENKIYEAVSQEGFIPKGSPVLVVKKGDFALIVSKKEKEQDSQQT